MKSAKPPAATGPTVRPPWKPPEPAPAAEPVDEGLGVARVNATLEQLLKLEKDAFRWVDSNTDEWITRRNIVSVTKFLASDPTRIMVSYSDGQQDELLGKQADAFLEWFKAGLSNP